jgi:molybdopterin-guanine dinucleotide biosynthesis protein MobB
MPLWIAVCGPKKSGKTSVIEALIPVMKSSGYKVATLKHTIHQHTFDREGTDTQRHAEAGADRVGIVAPGRLVLFAYDLADKQAGLDEFMEKFFSDYDVVLCEGFRDSTYPKIVLDVDKPNLKEVQPPIILKFKPVTGDGGKPGIPEEVVKEILGHVEGWGE